SPGSCTSRTSPASSSAPRTRRSSPTTSPPPSSPSAPTSWPRSTPPARCRSSTRAGWSAGRTARSAGSELADWPRRHERRDLRRREARGEVEVVEPLEHVVQRGQLTQEVVRALEEGLGGDREELGLVGRAVVAEEARLTALAGGAQREEHRRQHVAPLRELRPCLEQRRAVGAAVALVDHVGELVQHQVAALACAARAAQGVVPRQQDEVAAVLLAEDRAGCDRRGRLPARPRRR